jgi:hypothetical protein
MLIHPKVIIILEGYVIIFFFYKALTDLNCNSHLQHLEYVSLPTLRDILVADFLKACNDATREFELQRISNLELLYLLEFNRMHLY